MDKNQKSNKVTELNLLIEEIKNDKNLTLKVSEKNPTKPDKLITITRNYFRGLKKSNQKWKIKTPDEGVLAIDVSESLENRALIFADALIKLLRERGHSLQVFTNQEYSNHNGTKIIVNGEYFAIRIRESNVRIMEQHPRYDWKEAKYFPSGTLTLKIDNFHRYEWRDSKKIKLEDKLPNILAYLEIRAKNKKEERIQREIRHKEFEKQRKIEEELRQRRNIELEAFKEVINHSSRWQKAIDLRNYIKVVEENAIQNKKMSHEIQNWLKWIKEKVDWYDPLIEKEVELFKNVDRNSL